MNARQRAPVVLAVLISMALGSCAPQLPDPLAAASPAARLAIYKDPSKPVDAGSRTCSRA